MNTKMALKDLTADLLFLQESF